MGVGEHREQGRPKWISVRQNSLSGTVDRLYHFYKKFDKKLIL